jgi:hypothetical protein
VSWALLSLQRGYARRRSASWSQSTRSIHVVVWNRAERSSINPAAVVGIRIGQVQRIRATSERGRCWGSWIESVELVGELAYGVHVACHCRFPGVGWEFNDERGACPALVVLSRCDASRIAREARQRQSAQGGEAGLNSGVSSGSIGGGYRLMKPDCEPRPEANDQRACDATLGL